MKNPQHSIPLHKVKVIFLAIITMLLSLAIILSLILVITEYKPDSVEALSIQGTASKEIAVGNPIDVLTWNIGYGSLGETADFFMDGGKSVNTASKKQVKDNLSAITDQIKSMNPDFIFLQEVDERCTRSHYLNEHTYLTDALTEYQSSYATNFKVFFIPYPLPPIGTVDAGIMTFSDCQIDSSARQSLPSPFSYFMRKVNLKRCLIITRVPMKGTNQELVLVNLHLEAYDDGEGKIAQTKLLHQILKEEEDKGNYVIAGGDFNQTFSSIDTSKYPVISEDYWQCGKIDTSEFNDEFQFVMDNSAPTCRSLDKAYAGSEQESFQYYMIDGFILSKNLTVNSIETKDLQFKYSDHNPVLLNVTPMN